MIGFAFLGGLSNLNVVIELQDGLWRSFLGDNWCLLLRIAGEDGSWELLGIIDREATAWDGGASTPDAGWISIALTLLTMGSFAFIGGFSTKSDVIVEFLESLWGSFLNNWSLFLLIAGEDSSWELGGIINGEATAWDGGAGAPDAGWVGIALTFFTVSSFALISSLGTSQNSHKFMGSHFLVLSHSLFMMKFHLSFSDLMNLMAVVKGKETKDEDDSARDFSFSENSLGHL